MDLTVGSPESQPLVVSTGSKKCKVLPKALLPLGEAVKGLAARLGVNMVKLEGDQLKIRSTATVKETFLMNASIKLRELVATIPALYKRVYPEGGGLVGELSSILNGAVGNKGQLDAFAKLCQSLKAQYPGHIQELEALILAANSLKSVGGLSSDVIIDLLKNPNLGPRAREALVAQLETEVDAKKTALEKMEIWDKALNHLVSEEKGAVKDKVQTTITQLLLNPTISVDKRAGYADKYMKYLDKEQRASIANLLDKDLQQLPPEKKLIAAKSLIHHLSEPRQLELVKELTVSSDDIFASVIDTPQRLDSCLSQLELIDAMGKPTQEILDRRTILRQQVEKALKNGALPVQDRLAAFKRCNFHVNRESVVKKLVGDGLKDLESHPQNTNSLLFGLSELINHYPDYVSGLSITALNQFCLNHLKVLSKEERIGFIENHSNSLKASGRQEGLVELCDGILNDPSFSTLEKIQLIGKLLPAISTEEGRQIVVDKMRQKIVGEIYSLNAQNAQDKLVQVKEAVVLFVNVIKAFAPHTPAGEHFIYDVHIQSLGSIWFDKLTTLVDAGSPLMETASHEKSREHALMLNSVCSCASESRAAIGKLSETTSKPSFKKFVTTGAKQIVPAKGDGVVETIKGLIERSEQIKAQPEVKVGVPAKEMAAEESGDEVHAKAVVKETPKVTENQKRANYQEAIANLLDGVNGGALVDDLSKEEKGELLYYLTSSGGKTPVDRRELASRTRPASKSADNISTPSKKGGIPQGILFSGLVPQEVGTEIGVLAVSLVPEEKG